MTPGLRTSEFKAALATVIVSLVVGIADWVPNKWAWTGGIAGAVSYILSRGHAKSGGGSA